VLHIEQRDSALHLEYRSSWCELSLLNRYSAIVAGLVYHR